MASIMGAIERVSPSVAASIDWLRPSTRGQWGGPMNGQARRRDIVRSIVAAINPEFVVETGTYRGDTTAFLADVSGVPVYSVEANRRFHLFAKWRLQQRPDIHLSLGDSREFLSQLPLSDSTRGFIYLDAHWHDDLPLPEELDIIASRWPDSVIMVDDFQVPGDVGYGYPTYRTGVSLTVDVLPSSMDDWERMYPDVPSARETGAIRGCLVLASTHTDTARILACGLRSDV